MFFSTYLLGLLSVIFSYLRYKFIAEVFIKAKKEGMLMKVKFVRNWLFGFALVTGIAVIQDSHSLASEGFRLSQTCAGCHGTAGASPGNTIPIIGGQNAAYLADAMAAYKSGEREFYVMNFIARAFSDTQIALISQWFSEQAWVDTSTPNRASLAANAESIANGKCAVCHGVNGEGGDLGPRLSGQPSTYLAKVLREYKEGQRTNANAAQMMIVRDLTGNEIESLAHYYSRLR